MMSPADPALDHDLPLGSRRSDVEEWPALRRDRQKLLKAHAEWKKRKHPDSGNGCRRRAVHQEATATDDAH
jgi:hypothetical protein